jgi:hypothetical protein
MEWLITLQRDVDVDEIDAMLSQWGSERNDSPPIPLGDSEQAIEVSGPRDLPQKAQADPRVVKVSPNSTLTLYSAQERC